MTIDYDKLFWNSCRQKKPINGNKREGIQILTLFQTQKSSFPYPNSDKTAAEIDTPSQLNQSRYV